MLRGTRRLLALLLALILCVSLFPAAALAEDGGTIAPAEEPEEDAGGGTIAPADDPAGDGVPNVPTDEDPEALPPADEIEATSGACGDDLTWTLENGVLTIAGAGDMWDWSWDDGPWYAYRESITSVLLPEGLTGIGDHAFYGCGELTSAPIPACVKRIGDYAFADCFSLPDITLPAGVTSIGDIAFGYCHEVTSVTIPAGLTEIGGGAFSGCLSLQTILVEDGNPNYTSENGILYNKAKTALLQFPAGRSGYVEIPAGVTELGDYAFAACQYLSGVTIPEGVTSIGDEAFLGCSIRSVTIPESVTHIGDGAFWGCYVMTSATILANVTGISAHMFAGCRELTSVTLPESVTSIGDCAFYMCDSLPGITLPAGVTSIGEYAFYMCSALTGITIPAGVTSIGWAAFEDCSALTEITIPAGVTTIGIAVFKGCTLLKTAGPLDGDYDLRFGWTDSIPDGAFTGDDCLISVAIPQSITQIGEFAFRECSSLTAIDVAAGNENYSSIDGILYNKDRTILLRCPGGKAGAVQIPEGVTAIGTDAFNNCRYLTEVTIPEGVESIGYMAFSNCTSLPGVTLPESLKRIEDCAFLYCPGLVRVTIPAGVAIIRSSAFAYCFSLAEILFKGSAPQIGNYAFRDVAATAYYPAGDESWTGDVMQNYGGEIRWVSYPNGQCGETLSWSLGPDGVLTISGAGDMWDWSWDDVPWYAYRESITALVLPEGLTGIGDRAFVGCSSLTYIRLPQSVSHIGESAFQECFSLTDIYAAEGNENYSSFDGILYDKDRTTLLRCPCGKAGAVQIPEGVTAIGKEAFNNCRYLTEVTIPEGVESIGGVAFTACTSLTRVTLPDSLTNIEGSAFLYCGSLSCITIPAGIVNIRPWTFAYCTGLTEILFKGSAPEIADNAFLSVTATAFCPQGDESWTEDVMQNYGGSISWVSYVPSSFSDVKEGKYYYFPVLWAISQDPPITNGTDGTHFSPNATCTRAQIVTFLWNAFGKPEPSSGYNPFVDVKEGKFYTKAVLWAVEKGITTGVDATHFGPNDNCTRAQVVTFLWNAYGKPEPNSGYNPFVDVKEGKFYTKAVLWAVEMGVTSGVDAAHFGTGSTCTRGQVVAFLYRTKDFPKPD